MSTASLADHYRALTDEQLERLFAARPDLAVPVPSDFSVLAQRAHSRMSVARALDHLDQFHLEVLDALRLVGGPEHRADRKKAFDLLSGASDFSAHRAIDHLVTLGLAWPDGESVLRLPTVLDEVASRYPAGLGRPVAALVQDDRTEDLTPILAALHLPSVPQPEATALIAEAFADPVRLSALLDACPPEATAMLERLANGGNPVGAIRDVRRPADPTDADTPLRWLLVHSLLVPLDASTVELPREVGLALRGDAPLGPLHPTEPTPTATTAAPTDRVDGAGSGQVLEVLRQTATLLDACAAEPPPVLKAGGLGVRDLRRLARTAGIDEPTAALLLDVAHEAGLLARTPDADPTWLPTAAFDVWQATPAERRWAQLAGAWLAMARMPALVGTRDERDRAVAALSAEVTRSAAPTLRAQILQVLVEYPGPLSEPDVISVLDWRAPRRGGRRREEVIREQLAEATTLGIVAQTTLTRYGRALVTGEDPVPLLTDLLPEPVDHVLVQADLTVVAPGPLEPALAAEMALVADVESAGGATVYRVTPESVRRALDAGRSGSDLQTFFATRSRTPVPQSLSYLVDDVARRHGGLRVGAAGSYLRTDDPALLATVLADRRCVELNLRRIADTVLVSSASVQRVVDLLRGCGYVPAAEDAGGGLVLGWPEARRAPGRSNRGAPRGASEISLDHDYLAGAVVAVRRGDEAARAARRAPVLSQQGAPDPGAALGVLQQAARDRARVWLSYVDAHGGVTARVVRPVSVGAGYLRAEDDRTETEHTFALHRVVSAIRTQE
ncbi:helicase-associated domain-containing protein [Cryptosporangium aurantiacum]|uniref:Helicase conserved C-terminal domain-containing protein n=1 Tax=Cryptosporangium aurantiacum TaxID=134849 RepID=A0A1M7N311_9ACTN|nr:helicase-associated domain-containing protein [Cryptosporangium aurantiacum]SHM97350.1 Helicase conserved C-terminal domain-containing protein [Cryptosporangium aurantiacum]